MTLVTGAAAIGRPLIGLLTGEGAGIRAITHSARDLDKPSI
jgi:hypothetical protein